MYNGGDEVGEPDEFEVELISSGEDIEDPEAEDGEEIW